MGVQQLAQRAVLDVDECVVGLDPLRFDPVGLKEGQGPFDERGDRLGALIWVKL